MNHPNLKFPVSTGGAKVRRIEVVSTDPTRPSAERVQLVQVERPVLQTGQARIGMLAMTINPADLLQLDGRYGTRPALPFVPGHEGVAVVLEVADDVRGLAVGDQVLPMAPGGYWTDERVVSARALVRLPAAGDPLQCAMLTANPATAWVLLRHMVELEPTAWVIQNAANSAVGQCVRQLAQPLGLGVVNVVRRADAIEGPDTDRQVWIVDSGKDPEALAQAVARATGGHPVRLGLDAVGGSASAAMARSLADGGLLVVYGLMSGEPCAVPAHDLVFRALEVRGFWLARWFADAANREKARSLYPDLLAMLQAGTLRIEIEAVYPLAQVHAALSHAARGGRSGKILLTGEWFDRIARPAGQNGQPDMKGH